MAKKVVVEAAGTRVATQQTIGNSASQPGRVAVRRRPVAVVPEAVPARKLTIDNDYILRRIANLESKIFGPDYVYHDAISEGQTEDGGDYIDENNNEVIDDENVVIDENAEAASEI